MNKQPKKYLVAFAAVFGLLLVAPAAVSAQAIDCNTTGALANALNTQLRAELNRNFGGYEQRFNRRKKLTVHSVDSISFRGCTATMTARVTLHRKLRRDAHGTLVLTGNVSVREIRGGRARIRIDRPRVADVALSRTGAIGEAFYKIAANRNLPCTADIWAPIPAGIRARM